jgi:hypothetical protein
MLLEEALRGLGDCCCPWCALLQVLATRATAPGAAVAARRASLTTGNGAEVNRVAGYTCSMGQAGRHTMSCKHSFQHCRQKPERVTPM